MAIKITLGSTQIITCFAAVTAGCPKQPLQAPILHRACSSASRISAIFRSVREVSWFNCAIGEMSYRPIESGPGQTTVVHLPVSCKNEHRRVKAQGNSKQGGPSLTRHGWARKSIYRSPRCTGTPDQSPMTRRPQWSPSASLSLCQVAKFLSIYSDLALQHDNPADQALKHRNAASPRSRPGCLAHNVAKASAVFARLRRLAVDPFASARCVFASVPRAQGLQFCDLPLDPQFQDTAFRTRVGAREHLLQATK